MVFSENISCALLQYWSMYAYLKKIPAVVLLAIGGSCIFFSFGTFLLLLSVQHIQLNAQIAEFQNTPFFELGQYYFNSDDNPSGPYDLVTAQYYYEQEIARAPKENNLLWYQSGRVDFINGDFDNAIEKFDKQIEYFGDEIPNVHYMIGLTYGYKARKTDDVAHWRLAEEAFGKSIEFFYEAPWPRVDLAWIYFAQGKYEQMKPVLEEGFLYEANNPWLLNMYGLALLNTGDKDMAHEYFTFAKEIAGKMTVSNWGRSYPGNDPESWEEGLNEFKELIQKNIDLTEQQI